MPDAPRLASYLCGQWQTGQGHGLLACHAASGALVARVDATGLDMAAALDHARRSARVLRRLTFHDRAAILKALGQHLMAQKETFYTLSTATGATRRDSWIDIEGGIGTMLAYASRGRRELPAANHITEGPVEALSNNDSFSAVHILTPLQGAAIHINAYNFPCWGMLEKFAPTFLAGLPSIIKPASQTAFLTEAMVRAIIASGLLPAGSLQLVCGSLGDLLDHVTGQDVVTFTGSAATGHRLRAHPAILANSTRFTMEADSLNAAILGPDATEGTPEFDLFCREVVQEMTVKAGQKCTAIRRILVPRAHMDAVAAALVARLRAIQPADPGDPATRLGPLVSLGQRADVLTRIAQLRTEAEALTPDHPLSETGAFLHPTLLACHSPLTARAVHEVEAFGPVATLMPYDDPDEAAHIASLGKGSLVASVFTNDPGAARDIALGLAPFHGRVLIGNRDAAKSSTGHGSPLAQLVHGGPGRAGGGEELGGLRAVKHYMQRSAIQASPRLLTAVTGQWSEGAATRADVHPFRKSLTELAVGDQITTATRTVTLEDIEHFAHFTGDTFYAHMDEEAARANPFFEGRVAHGYLILSFAAGLFVDPDPGPVLANYGVDNLRFLTPVNPGDTLQVRLTCKDITPRGSAAHGEVRWDARVTNQHGATVATYDVLTMVARDWPLPAAG